MDRRWIDAHRMKGGMPRIQDEATRLRERAALRKLSFMLKASHVVPVAFIQVTDFASDIMVIVQLALVDGLAADWVVCVAAICLSLLVAWGSILKETTEAKKETYLPAGDQLIACLFACGKTCMSCLWARASSRPSLRGGPTKPKSCTNSFSRSSSSRRASRVSFLAWSQREP